MKFLQEPLAALEKYTSRRDAEPQRKNQAVAAFENVDKTANMERPFRALE